MYNINQEHPFQTRQALSRGSEKYLILTRKLIGSGREILPDNPRHSLVKGISRNSKNVSDRRNRVTLCFTLILNPPRVMIRTNPADY